MNTTTKPGTESLFANPPEPPTGFVLWYRAGRRQRWEPVHTAATERECVGAMATGCSGTKRNGMWLILPNGQEP